MENRKWHEMYSLSKQYRYDNGNLLIPLNYTTKDNIQLGLWISRQRKQYKQGKLSKEKTDLLERIGMVWNPFDVQWNKSYELAKKYYEDNGNLLVPQSYVTDAGESLGRWIRTQRKRYRDKKISSIEIERLERIGMIWNQRDFQWQEFYDLAVEYYKTYSNLLVPQRFITKDRKNLGEWISTQRANYKANKLSKERIDLLEKIGMVWDGIDASWNEMFKIAQQYYEENSNLKIPITHAYKDVNLGWWIQTQRQKYEDNTLSKARIEKLNGIGMEWVSTITSDYMWDHNYNLLVAFYNRYKHLYVPYNYVSEDGAQIGKWLADQKQKYKNNKLNEYRKSKMDLLDKSWLESANTKSSFPEQAVLLYIKRYFPSACKLNTKEISEIDIYIPALKVGIEYDGPSHAKTSKKDIAKTKKCKELGIKLVRIRDCNCPIIEDESYKIILKDNSFEALDYGIIELLKHLGVPDISVSVKRDYSEIIDNYINYIDLDWHLAYEKLIEYYNENGNIDVPIYYKTADGFLLGHWLSNIRSSIKNPNLKNIRMSSIKMELLNQLGMDWAPLDTQWGKMYSFAEEYYAKNGDLLVPDKYVVHDNVYLGRWIATQRFNYKENILSSKKIGLLEKIGMVWSVHDYEWTKMYNLAVDYYKENGNLLVPQRYKAEDNKPLGAWISRQRAKYKSKQLPIERINQLEQIGMIWSLDGLRWQEFYELAVEYYKENGNLLVPQRYKTIDDKSLGLWVHRQRTKHKSNTISDKEITLLDKIGMVWDL